MVRDNVTLQDVVLEVQNLRNELEIWKTKVSECNKIIDQVSSKIRSEIKEDMKPTPWPFHPSDAIDHSGISHHLEQFLVGLLTGDPNGKSTPHRVSP